MTFFFWVTYFVRHKHGHIATCGTQCPFLWSGQNQVTSVSFRHLAQHMIRILSGEPRRNAQTGPLWTGCMVNGLIMPSKKIHTRATSARGSHGVTSLVWPNNNNCSTPQCDSISKPWQYVTGTQIRRYSVPGVLNDCWPGPVTLLISLQELARFANGYRRWLELGRPQQTTYIIVWLVRWYVTSQGIPVHLFMSICQAWHQQLGKPGHTFI